MGTIRRTAEGGTTWTSQSSGTQDFLFGVSFTDLDNGTAVGKSGTILRTTTGGVVSVEDEVIDEIPREFLRSQNFPNPFNPSTKIKFTISTVERFAESLNNAERIDNSLYNITLKVYDVLGNEVTTLADEDKPAGTYEVEFNPANHQLSSGIYFYQLKAVPTGRQAGNFNQAKKMLFIK